MSMSMTFERPMCTHAHKRDARMQRMRAREAPWHAACSMSTNADHRYRRNRSRSRGQRRGRRRRRRRKQTKTTAAPPAPAAPSHGCSRGDCPSRLHTFPPSILPPCLLTLLPSYLPTFLPFYLLAFVRAPACCLHADRPSTQPGEECMCMGMCTSHPLAFITLAIERSWSTSASVQGRKVGR